ARDEHLFHYLADCAPNAQIVHGDARLSLRKLPDGRFDLLILDAFSSDSIPLHLMTREALQLYRDKLAPGGVLMFHISNRRLDLAPILGNGAAAVGMVARDELFTPAPQARDPFRYPARWIAIARRPEDLAMLDGDARWKPLPRDPRADLWTDEYSNIFGAMRW
ncbi:MAG: fused MFS/spermidine synthase, partial [Candidatus Eiseniibacteriota bacterium]